MRLRLAVSLVLCLALAAPARAYRLEGGRWPDAQIPITWYLDQDGTRSLGPNSTTASVKSAVQAGFSAWHAVSGVKIAFNAPIDLAAAQRNAQNDGKNKLYWVEAGEGWQYDTATLGVTTPLWYQGSGEIVDADIEFNARDYRWQTGPNNYIPCDQCADTLSIAVHEEGHFIGMAHSCEINEIEANRCNQAQTDAVMLAAYPGYPKQILQADDIAGVRALYPAPNPGSGQQGWACTQDVDCANPLKCRSPKGGGNKVCTTTCAQGGSCAVQGLACIEANTGFACLSPADAVGDLCHSCASGSGCSSGLCMQTQEFAYCARACSPTTLCPGSGYVCVGEKNGQGAQCDSTMTNCFCFPSSATCANNCDAQNPCPTGQSCQAGTCKYQPGAEDQPCPTGQCVAGLVCAGTSANDAMCHRTCNPTGTNTCPQGQECYQLSGGTTEGACFKAEVGTAQEGQSCGTANCAPNLLCVGTSATDATCRRECNPASPSCPTNQKCAELTSGNGACVPGQVDPPPTKAKECEACSSSKPCDSGLFCVNTNGSPICRKGCSTQAACSGTNSCEAKSGIPGFSGTCTCGGTTPTTSGEGGACTQDSECQAGLMCVADHTQPVGACRKACTTDANCPSTQACTTIGAAKVCEAKAAETPDAGTTTDDETPRNTSPCGCASGGPGMLAALLGLAGVMRRRRLVQG